MHELSLCKNILKIIKQYYETCKNCGSNKLNIIAGEEFNVKSIEIE